MKNAFLRCGILLFLLANPLFAEDGQLQFASLGDFQLTSGGAILDCRVAAPMGI